MTNHLSEENVLKAVAKANKEQKDLVDEYRATCKALKESDEHKGSAKSTGSYAYYGAASGAGGVLLKESDEKPRWSQCNDCFDGDHNKCSGGICACSLVHPEHHPMNESKPQDWEKYIGYEFEKCAGPHCNHETSDEHLFVTVEAMKDALTHGYQEGVKAGEKRALEWVLKDVDLSSSSVEQIANRLDTPKNQ